MPRSVAEISVEIESVARARSEVWFKKARTEEEVWAVHQAAVRLFVLFDEKREALAEPQEAARRRAKNEPLGVDSAGREMRGGKMPWELTGYVPNSPLREDPRIAQARLNVALRRFDTAAA